jgi:hypothetical protein
MYAFRIPADTDYLQQLGRAVYNFATYEWMVAWTLEKLEPGFLKKCVGRRGAMTSRQVARHFADIVNNDISRLPANGRSALDQKQQEFARLVQVRDQLIHAHPGTAPGGGQQLYYSGRHPQMEWPVEQVERAAIDFENAFISANELFYRLWPNA